MKKVRNGDVEKVSVNLKFDGTIRNHIITVEDQFIPTTNGTAVEKEIRLDGEPIQITGRFRGSRNSEVKSFDVTINGQTFSHSPIKLKSGEVEVKNQIPFDFFKLEEI